MRWSYETLSEMARIEAALPDNARFVNQAIKAKLPAYTIEQIKGVRNKRNDYNELLNSFKERNAQQQESEVEESPVPAINDTWAETLLQAINFEGLLNQTTYVRQNPDINKQEVLDEIFNSHVKAKVRNIRPQQEPQTNPQPLSRKKTRKTKFRKIQNNFRKDKTQTANSIINGSSENNEKPLPPDTETFWRETSISAGPPTITTSWRPVNATSRTNCRRRNCQHPEKEE